HWVVKIRSPSDWAAPARVAKPVRARASRPGMRRYIGKSPVFRGDYKAFGGTGPARRAGSGVGGVMTPQAAEGIEHELPGIAPVGFEFLRRTCGIGFVRSVALHQLLHQPV